ncbi:MAG: hypothetical protein ACUVWS_07510 [Roseiflexus sp.]
MTTVIETPTTDRFSYDGTDIAVISSVREPKHRSTFDVAAEGVRPTPLIEVTSPVIVDVVQRRGQVVARLPGYRRTPTVLRRAVARRAGALVDRVAPDMAGVRTGSDVRRRFRQTNRRLPRPPAALMTAEQRIAALEAELHRLRSAGNVC